MSDSDTTTWHDNYSSPINGPINVPCYNQVFQIQTSTVTEQELANKIDKLSNKIDMMIRQNDQILEHLKYMPGGEGYFKAKQDFEERVSK